MATNNGIVKNHNECVKDHTIYWVAKGHTEETCLTCRYFTDPGTYFEMCSRDRTFVPWPEGAVCKGWEQRP